MNIRKELGQCECLRQEWKTNLGVRAAMIVWVDMNNANTQACKVNTRKANTITLPLFNRSVLIETLRGVAGDAWPFIHTVQTFIIIQIWAFSLDHRYMDMSISSSLEKHSSWLVEKKRGFSRWLSSFWITLFQQYLAARMQKVPLFLVEFQPGFYRFFLQKGNQCVHRV